MLDDGVGGVLQVLTEQHFQVAHFSLNKVLNPFPTAESVSVNSDRLTNPGKNVLFFIDLIHSFLWSIF